MARTCHRCGAQVGPDGHVGRRDACLGCGADLHCCRNCAHHDPQLHNQCREPHAEIQADRERGNFCEFFAFRAASASAEVSDAAKSARARLDALFAKKAAE
jgi:hypothetical protein